MLSATPEPARTDEIAAAFRLLFQQLPADEAEQRVTNALALIHLGQLATDGLFVLRDKSGLQGALIGLPLPGASGTLWPAQVRRGLNRREVEDRLYAHALNWMRRRGIKLVQVLLTPDETDEAAALKRHGFEHVTHLWHLCHHLREPLPVLRNPRLREEPFDATNSKEFEHTLLRTYEGSLDCPEVNGTRSVAEILESHRAQGDFDPDRWWLLREEGKPVGVVVVMEQPESGDWELVYFGIVPEARSRGLGREAITRVLLEARHLARTRIDLSVDGRNLPARDLYRSLGFEPVECREVYLSLERKS